MSIEMWRADDDQTGLRSRLQGEVFGELAREPGLDRGDLRVDVSGRAVILSGTVRSLPQRLSAERAARRVRGVRDVRNEIAVVLPSSQVRSDEDLVEAAACVIESDVLVPRGKIEVVVVSGWIELAGAVVRHAERQAAEEAVQRLVGVRGVTNLITIEPAGAERDVKAVVAEALERRPALRGDRIKVEVVGGLTVLRGKVRSLAERDEAVAAAWGTPGVTSVRDRLRVAA
jgi:osmotically-inducible protein OsmY